MRSLAQEVDAKSRIVHAVETEAFFTGRAPGRIWQAWQQNGGRPAAAESPGDGEFANDPGGAAGTFADDEAAFEEGMKRMFAKEGIDEDDPMAGAFREFARETFGFGGEPKPAPDTADAREIYCRLVRHLHPDRGGEWTPARARLWEQVQAAWGVRDADWLARLEAEWEASADLLGPASPLGRLRAALAEIDAARRDVEKRVRLYRKEYSWRFSLRRSSEALRERMLRQLRHDEVVLRTKLDELEAVMAAWERAASRRPKRRRRTPQPL